MLNFFLSSGLTGMDLLHILLLLYQIGVREPCPELARTGE